MGVIIKDKTVCYNCNEILSSNTNIDTHHYQIQLQHCKIGIKLGGCDANILFLGSKIDFISTLVVEINLSRNSLGDSINGATFQLCPWLTYASTLTHQMKLWVFISFLVNMKEAEADEIFHTDETKEFFPDVSLGIINTDFISARFSI